MLCRRRPVLGVHLVKQTRQILIGPPLGQSLATYADTEAALPSATA
jgi:hypothetical protein